MFLGVDALHYSQQFSVMLGCVFFYLPWLNQYLTGDTVSCSMTLRSASH